VLTGQKEKFDQIIFLIEGSFKVGYNREFFLFENGVKSASELGKVFVQRKTKIPLLSSFKHEESDIAEHKFEFPLTIRPGQAIGLFELTFNQESSYIYRNAHDDSSVCYFVRLQNWHRLIQETDSLSDISKAFKKYALSDYLNKIYYPITLHQNQLVKKERQK